ncbi:unnamed protein product [Prorocentrum cordatum]|uniref:Uncharacterized protein n=1 Tax=Prorocentrum cordatum TaxID=2364126 RepID=A0ABN9TUX1_9DINO|nr:unnamed protein product [Polarella glacialis]
MSKPAAARRRPRGLRVGSAARLAPVAALFVAVGHRGELARPETTWATPRVLADYAPQPRWEARRGARGALPQARSAGGGRGRRGAARGEPRGGRRAAAQAAGAGRERSDKAALEAAVDENFASLGPEQIAQLQIKVAEDILRPEPGQPGQRARGRAPGLHAEAHGVLQRAHHGGLLDHKKMNIMGDVQRVLKKAENPLPLLMVLQINIQQAQEEGDEDKLRALMHIYTVMNEEMEKKVSKVQALLNKLLRMEDFDPNVRENILRHHLQPAEVAAPPGLDDFDDEPSAPTLSAALVPPERLAKGIAELVAKVDQSLQAALGEDDNTERFETLEKVRQVAKDDARRIIGDIYGDGEMNSFSADLTPTFHTLMAHKARMNPNEAPAPPTAAEAAASRGNAVQVGAEAQGAPPSPGPTTPMPQ